MRNRYEFKKVMKIVRELQKEYYDASVFTSSDLAWASSDRGIRKIDSEFKHGIEIWYDRDKTNPRYYLVVNNNVFKKYVKKNINMNINGMDRCNGEGNKRIWLKYGKKCEFIENIEDLQKI